MFNVAGYPNEPYTNEIYTTESRLFSFVKHENTSDLSSTYLAIPDNASSCTCLVLTSEDFACSWQIDNHLQLVSIALSTISIAWATVRFGLERIFLETTGKQDDHDGFDISRGKWATNDNDDPQAEVNDVPNDCRNMSVMSDHMEIADGILDHRSDMKEMNYQQRVADDLIDHCSELNFEQEAANEKLEYYRSRNEISDLEGPSSNCGPFRVTGKDVITSSDIHGTLDSCDNLSNYDHHKTVDADADTDADADADADCGKNEQGRKKIESFFHKHRRPIILLIGFPNVVIGISVSIYMIFNLVLTRSILFLSFIPLILFRAATPDMLRQIWGRVKESYTKKCDWIDEDVQKQDWKEQKQMLFTKNGSKSNKPGAEITSFHHERITVDDHSFLKDSVRQDGEVIQEKDERITTETIKPMFKSHDCFPICRYDCSAVWRTISLCFAPIFLRLILNFDLALDSAVEMERMTFSSMVLTDTLLVKDNSPMIILRGNWSLQWHDFARDQKSKGNTDDGWRMADGTWLKYPTAYRKSNPTLTEFKFENFNLTSLHRQISEYEVYMRGWIDNKKWANIIRQIYGDLYFREVRFVMGSIDRLCFSDSVRHQKWAKSCLEFEKKFSAILAMPHI